VPFAKRITAIGEFSRRTTHDPQLAPGGFLEADEYPEAGAIRELCEETGLAIAITGLLGIDLDGYCYDDPDGGETTLNLCYLATATGEPQADDDAAAVGWFAPDELSGAAEIEFRHQLRVFADWRRMAGDETPPTFEGKPCHVGSGPA